MSSPRKISTPGGRKGAAVTLLFLVALLAAIWLLRKNGAKNHPVDVGTVPSASPSGPRPGLPTAPPPEPLPGEMILARYGSPETRPQDDLHAVSRALTNLALLVKGGDPFRIGANEEFAAALRGRNRTQLRFLPDDHPAFNAQGQLVDRWKTPLFFHAQSRDRIEIRSAGPDRKMWTEDDLQRQSDGQFLKGPSLNAPSLFKAEPSR